MKTALVCIAKNEDYYINEWIQYHLKLGFDDIFVYKNNWNFDDTKILAKNVKWITFNGNRVQLNAYNSFISQNINNYDWAAFFDVDEFLCIPNMTLKDYLTQMNIFYGIGINWKFFGDNGLTFSNDYSVLKRFTKCQQSCNMHIKTILHLSKLKMKYSNSSITFRDPHSIQLSMNNNLIVSSNGKQFIHGPFNKNYNDTIVLNHYFCKTRQEFENKKLRGRALSPKPIDDNLFIAHNFNEVENTIAYDFFNGTNK